MKEDGRPGELRTQEGHGAGPEAVPAASPNNRDGKAVYSGVERAEFRQALRAHASIVLPTGHTRAPPDARTQARTEKVASAQKKAVCGHVGHTALTTRSLHLRKTQDTEVGPG